MFRKIWNVIFGSSSSRPLEQLPVGDLASDPLIDRLTYNLSRPSFLLNHPNPASDSNSPSFADFYSAKEILRRGLKAVDFPSSGKTEEWKQSDYAFIEILPPDPLYRALFPGATAAIAVSLGNETAVAVFDPNRGVVHAQ